MDRERLIDDRVFISCNSFFMVYCFCVKVVVICSCACTCNLISFEFVCPISITSDFMSTTKVEQKH